MQTHSTRTRRSARVRSAALGLACLSVLTACAGEGSPFSLTAPTPTPTPTATQPPPPPPDATLGAPLPPIDPSGIPTAYGMSIRTGGDRPIVADWTYLDGGEPLNAHLDAWLFGALDAWSSQDGAVAARFEPTLPQAQDPAVVTGTLSMRTETVQASGTFYGVRLLASRESPTGPPSPSTSVVFFDTSNGNLVGSTALVAPEQIAALQQIVAKTIDPPVDETDASDVEGSAGDSKAGKGSRRPPKPAEPPISSVLSLTPDQLLGDIAFAPNGDLVLSYPSGQVAPVADGPIAVHVRAEIAGALLSDLGRTVQQQAATPFAAPAPAALGTRHIDCDLVPCVALTYDDGPRPDTTSQLLDILREQGVFATFFDTGASATSYPETALAASQAGHLVESHTWNHPDLTTLDPAAIQSQYSRTQTAITNATGIAPIMLRPPYGAFNASVKANIPLPLIYWSVDSLDWSSLDPNVFVPKVLNTVKPGGIVLMHDIHPTTIAGQTQLITALRDAGYHFVRVDQLFHGIPMEPGHVFFCRGVGKDCTPGR